MKKGDERKQAIVDTAERLFFEKGYENTSIQEILDALQLSKGGFYHHFESKQQLLEVICQQHAQASCEKGIEAAKRAGNSAVARLNALLREGGFFGEQALKYVSLVLTTAYAGPLSQMRERMRETTLSAYEEIVENILLDGMEQEVFYISHPENMAKLVILLALDVTDEVAFMIARWKRQSDALAAMMDLLGTYREAVEKILNAPYGSIDLIETRRIAQVLNALGLLTGSFEGV